jgi:hypothetical protein
MTYEIEVEGTDNQRIIIGSFFIATTYVSSCGRESI